MKPYIATFRASTGERYEMFCAGKNDTLANANAWTKFRRTQWYQDAPNAWELSGLRRCDWDTMPASNPKGQPQAEYKIFPHYIKVCGRCSSQDVYCCATAEWHEEDQLWGLCDVTGTEICNSCGGETNIITKEIHLNSVGA